jgi:hypothetical protein
MHAHIQVFMGLLGFKSERNSSHKCKIHHTAKLKKIKKNKSINYDYPIYEFKL